MREIHYEETSRVNNEVKTNKRYKITMGVSYGSLVVGIFWLVFFINFCDFSKMHPSNVLLFIVELMFWILPIIIFIVLFIIFRKIGKKTYVEYDYSFLSGEVRVAKVPKNSYRKGVIRFQASSIDRIGKKDSKSYENFSSMPGVKKLKLTVNSLPSEGCSFYYMLIRHEGIKKLLIFDCSELFIANVLKFCNARAVLDRDYK